MTTSSVKDVDEHENIFFCNERVDFLFGMVLNPSETNIYSCENYVCVALANWLYL